MLWYAVIVLLLATVHAQSAVNPDEILVKPDRCAAIRNLEPQNVFDVFCELSGVPRPSYKPEKIQKWISDLGKRHGFEKKQDAAGNVVLKVSASTGYENAPLVCLQSHMDMVTEKNPDKEFNFDEDPIELVRDGEFIRANGTTLGADNGIGMAIAIAAATDPTVKHGPLELLFTAGILLSFSNHVDEEVGLVGASHVNEQLISSKILFNIDSYLDPMFIGCAGGETTTGFFSFQKLEKAGNTYKITIDGLMGGHSGVDIHQQRANAIKVLSRVLRILLDQKIEFYIGSVRGGSWDNAIPRFAQATVQVQQDKVEQITQACKQLEKDLLVEHGSTDPLLSIRFEATDAVSTVISHDDSVKLTRVLCALPHGYTTMKEGSVQTSTNLASIATTVGETLNVTVVTSQRSDVDSAKIALAGSIRAIFHLANAQVTTTGAYPGWTPNPDSKLLAIAKDVFKEQFGKELRTLSIHAGLEAGSIRAQFSKETAPDVIAFGVAAHDAHSPKERFEIKELQTVYEYTKRLLEKLAK